MSSEQFINTNIVATANFSSLTAQLSSVTSQLLKLQQTVIGTNKIFQNQVSVMNRAFAENMRSTGQFATHFVTLSSDVENFGRNLDSGKLKLSQYYKTWQDHAKTSGGLIKQLAQQQVTLQNAVIQPLGKNAQGLMQYNVHVAQGLDTIANKTALAAMQAKILNKVMQDGANQLINWGKNTQWAGRQLTVGLTLPLAMFGQAASKAFLEADKELVRLTKVYGGLAATSATDLKKIRTEVAATAKELAAQYGASYTATIGLAADIAATGRQGKELLSATVQTTRLAVLGEVEHADAMKATLAIQSTFKQNTDELTQSIDFLNAVENQTSTTLNDLITAIPKAGPVIQAMGGSVKDLSLLLVAMKEGGINASEGANALKSALASLINPTKVAKGMFADFGIDLGGIVTKNAGNLTGTIMELQAALDKLNPLQKQQAIEQLFGKFQFSRMNALFANLGKQGSQTLQVLDLMKASAGDLANISSRELSQITESASGKYKRALESVKADMAQIGNTFLGISTSILKIIDGIIKFFGKLPDPLKKALTFLGGITAVAGPLIMLTGVLANFFGYIVKGLFHFKALFKGGEGWKYLTPEILAAEKAGSLIEKTFYSDAKAAATLEVSLHGLAAAYADLEMKVLAANIAAQPTISTLAGSTIMSGSTRVADPSHPLIGRPYSRSMAHLNPVSKMTEVERLSQTIFSTVPNPAPVNRKVGANPQMYMTGDMPLIPGVTSANGASTGIIASEAAKWHSMTAALAMQSEQELTLLKKEVSTTGGITTSLSTSYQRLLPEMTRLTTHAAQEGAKIVAALEAGALTVAQAQAEIVALNARIEAMMVQTASQIAAIESRSINLTSVPLLSQPIIDPITGKSNMKEVFRPGRTASTIDAIANALGVRTSGGGYSIATTKPKFLPIVKRNTGGEIFTAGTGAFVPGVGNTDKVPAMLTPGEFVVNKKQTQKDPQGLRDYNAGRAVIVPVQKFETGGEVLEGAHFSGNVRLTGEQIKNAPRLFDALPPHMQASVLQFPGQTFLIQDSQILTLPRILNKKLRLASRANLSKEQALGHIRGVPAATMFSGWNLDERLKERLKAELLTQISLSTPADPAAGYRDPDMERIFKTTKERLLNDTSLDYEDIKKFAFSFREAEQKTKVVLTTLKDVEASAKIFAGSKKLEKLRTELGIDIPKPDEVTRFSTSKNTDVTKNVGWFDANAKRIAERYFAKYPDKKNISIPNSQGKRNIWVNSGNGVATVHEGGATTAKLREAVVLVIDELTGRVRVGKLNPIFVPRDPRSAAMTRGWIARRETGGPVNKNTPYIVGEKGPELFIPRHDGGIIPNNKLNSGGPVAGVRYYGTGSGDGPVTADMFGSMEQAKKALRSGNPAVRAAAQVWLTAQVAKGSQIAVGGTPGVFQGEQSPGTRGSYTRGRGFTDYQIRGSQVSGIRAMPTYRPIYDNNPFRGWQPGVGTMSAVSSLRSASSEAYARAGARVTILQLTALNKLLEVQTAAKNALQTSGIVIKELRGTTTARLSDAYARSTYRPTSFRELSPFNPTGYNARRVPGQPFGASLGNHPFAVSMAASAGGMYAASKINNSTLAGIVSTVSGVLPFMLPQMLMQKKGAKAALLNDEAKLLAERNGTTIAQERQALIAKQQAEKAAAQAARTSALASKTSIGTKIAAGAEKGMLALMLAQGAKAMGLFARISPMLLRIGSILKSFTIPGAILTALFMIGKYLWDAHKAAQAAIQAQADSFKLNEKQAKQAGIAYVDFKKKVEDVREQQRLMMEAGRIALQSNKNSSIGGLVFSYQELRKATKDAKKNMPDVVKMFNDLNFDQVADAAANLKVQFVSQGMSAEKAAIKIYGIVAASNKAGQAADAISTKEFQAIQDKSTAATASVQGLAKAIKSDLDAKIIVSSFEAMVSAVDASTKALIGTKDETGHVITEAEALEATFKQIHNTQQGNVKLGEDGLKAIQDQNPLLIGILNKNDTIAGTYAKMRLVLQGIGGDLSAVNSKTAQAMLLVKEGIDSAALAMATGTDEQGVKVQSGNLTALVTLVDHYKKASLAAALASTSAAKKASDGNKAEIKSIQEKIAAINDEADARKRALEQQTSTEDAKIQLQKLQLDYQDAIASGNTKDAAQIQLSIRQLILHTNKTQALAAIEEKRIADLKIQNALLAKAQEKANAAQLKATNQSTAAQNAANTLSTIQSIQSTIASLISQRATADPTTEPGKLIIAGLDSQFKKQLAELTKYGALGKNAANALSPGGIYNAKLPSGDYGASLAKLSSDALETASSKFVGGVDKFALYVDKLNGTSGLAYSEPPKPVSPPGGGPGKTNYMDFSSPDGKKNVQVIVTPGTTKSAYDAYVKGGWQFVQYSNTQNPKKEAEIWDGNMFRQVPKLAVGGQILHYGPGGGVNGPGTATSDSIPAMLSDGEYVIRASAVKKYGVANLDAMNAQKLHTGGPVGHQHSTSAKFPMTWIPYRPDMPNYWSNGKPSGSPNSQRWGELRYNPGPGTDRWGGKELSGHEKNEKKYKKDYWHQLLEQPNKSSGPGMGIDKYTPPLVGNGASAMTGGLLGGGGGNMIGFHKGGLAEAGHKHGIAGLWDKFKNQANKSLTGSITADILNQLGTLGQTALASLAPTLVPKPTKTQIKDIAEFTGIPSGYRALSGKTSEGPLGQINPKAGKVADWAGLLTFFTPGRGSARLAERGALAASESIATPPITLSPTEIFRSQFANFDASGLPKGTVTKGLRVPTYQMEPYKKILARNFMAKRPDPRTLTQHEVAVLETQKVPGFEGLRVHADQTADAIANDMKLKSTFNYNAPLTRSESSIEELLSKSLFHGGNLPTIDGKIDLKNRTGLNNWYGGQMFASEDYRQALAYLLKSPENSVYSIKSALKKEDVIDLRHNANTLATQQPFVFAKLLRDIESGKIELQQYQSKKHVLLSLIGQEGGRYPHAAASGSLRDKIFQLYFKDISPWLAENGIKAIAHRNGTRVVIPEIGKSVSDNPTRVQDFAQFGTDALAYTTVENSIAQIQKHTITNQHVKDIVARIEAGKSDIKSSKIEAEIMALLKQSTEIPHKAMGGLMVPQARDWSNKTKFATGGMINKAKYNLPSPSVSINKSMMPNSNNSAVHHYDVGGLVINAQPGQDEKTIATMVVSMLDQKNMMREAMYGRQRSMSGGN